MIKVNGIVLKPTLFPDGTSQVWHQPQGFFRYETAQFDWRYEGDHEMMQLMSARTLCGNKAELHVPFLPYGRQDKEVNNESCFNLFVFGEWLNRLNFSRITTVDVHSSIAFDWIERLVGFSTCDIKHSLISQIRPDYLCAPDRSARARLSSTPGIPWIFCDKERDPTTGEIKFRGMDLRGVEFGGSNPKILVVDDICDGGATFLLVASCLKKKWPDAQLHLFVTHGIFSKGKQALLDAGYQIYTTNSLPRNPDGFEV